MIRHLNLAGKLVILFACLILTSCFQDQKSSASKNGEKTAKSLITSEDFAGAISASNTITGIKIVWSPSAKTVSAYRVYRVAGASLSLLTSLAPNVSSYIDGSVVWGTVYSYVVRAVDLKGVEETNNVQVSSLAWSGISSVTAAGRTAITVNFSSPTPAADEIRIYVQGDSSETPIQATMSGSSLSKTITGLRPGYTYKVLAQAYVNSLKKEDGNTVLWPVTTMTTGYDDDPISGDTAAWMNVTNVRAFGTSPGSALHPVTPNKTPRTALVELSFKSFNGHGSSSKYVVTRAFQGQPLDTTNVTPCTATMTGSCRVMCNPQTATFELSGSGVLHCRDEQVGESPARYRYTISLIHKAGTLNWVEVLPQDKIENFSVLVPIPPANMVLAQRDAVNYEMCTSQMNLTPDPKKNNRCSYTGIGATPYNTGPNKAPLNLEGGYYDFGYNLFLDRYNMACKWTSQADGGRCGPGGSPGPCIDALPNGTPPDNSIGVDGNVFLALWPGIDGSNRASGRNYCFYKEGGVWYAGHQILSTVAEPMKVLKEMYTSDPAHNGGNVTQLRDSFTQYRAWASCAAQNDPHYGEKRLPRMREHRAYSTFPTVPNDLYYVSYSTANTWTSSANDFNAANGFRCAVNVSTTNYPAMTAVSSIATLLSNTTNEFFGFFNGSTYYNRFFKLAASATTDCQGRYGQEEPVNRSGHAFTSDNFNIHTGDKILTGTASNLDNGNIDLQMDLSGTWTGYRINYTPAPINGSNESYYNLYPTTTVASIAVPLGLPILSSSTTGYTSISTFPEHYGGAIVIANQNLSTTPRAVRVNGRWGTRLIIGALTGSEDSWLRCVLPAE